MLNCFIGKEVNHKTFGRGTVVSVSDKYFTIKFDNETKDYPPVSFSKCLSFLDPTLQEEVEKEIAEQINKAIDARNSRPTATLSAQINAAEKVTKRTGVFKEITKFTKLKAMDVVGDVARDIYDACCNAYGWNKDLRGDFAKQQGLFSKDAAGDNMSVFFVANSNWNKRKQSNWENRIHDGISLIDEVWKNIDDPLFLRDTSDRIVFAKKRNEEYVFLGVYKWLRTDEKTQTKYYELVSNSYSFKTTNNQANQAQNLLCA